METKETAGRVFFEYNIMPSSMTNRSSKHRLFPLLTYKKKSRVCLHLPCVHSKVGASARRCFADWLLSGLRTKALLGSQELFFASTYTKDSLQYRFRMNLPEN